MNKLFRATAVSAIVLLAGCAAEATTGGAGSSSPGPATSPATSPTAAATGPASVYDGVYSEAQVARGEALSDARCAACHSAEGEWGGGFLLLGYNGRPVWELVAMLRATMPMDAPGTLTLQEYTDVTAYILAINEIPAGGADLAGNEGRLREVTIEYRR